MQQPVLCIYFVNEKDKSRGTRRQLYENSGMLLIESKQQQRASCLWSITLAALRNSGTRLPSNQSSLATIGTSTAHAIPPPTPTSSPMWANLIKDRKERRINSASYPH